MTWFSLAPKKNRENRPQTSESLQFPKIDFKNDNKFVVLHEIHAPKDLIRIRNIDEDGKFISTAFLLNLPIIIKVKNYSEFIDKFNEIIRQILIQKYIGRDTKVTFDDYKVFPDTKCTIMQHV